MKQQQEKRNNLEKWDLGTTVFTTQNPKHQKQVLIAQEKLNNNKKNKTT